MIKIKKVVIIGCPGSGKSTFARKLRDVAKLPLYYLDMLWHKADKTTISTVKFDNQLNQILRLDEWIIDGNYIRTLEVRLEKADTVFFLDYSFEVCLAGAKARIGMKRVDFPWLETDFDQEFKKQIESCFQDQVPKINEILNKYKKKKNIIIFKHRVEAENYINFLLKKVNG